MHYLERDSIKLEALYIKSLASQWTWCPGTVFPDHIATSSKNSALIFFLGTNHSLINLRSYGSDEIYPSRSFQNNPFCWPQWLFQGWTCDPSQLNWNQWESVSEFYLTVRKETCVFPLDPKLIKRKLGGAGSYLHLPWNKCRENRTWSRRELAQCLSSWTSHVRNSLFLLPCTFTLCYPRKSPSA